MEFNTNYKLRIKRDKYNLLWDFLQTPKTRKEIKEKFNLKESQFLQFIYIATFLIPIYETDCINGQIKYGAWRKDDDRRKGITNDKK